MELSDLTIELLDKRVHDRRGFSCGVAPLDEYLKKHANQNQRDNISKTFVAYKKNCSINPKAIQGYYTLSSGHITWDKLPDKIKSALPKYPVPIAKIGRLAVNINHQKSGVGGLLLHDALMRVVSISRNMGIFAVVVDVKDGAKQFYINYGFTALSDSDSSSTYFIPIKTLELLI